MSALHIGCALFFAAVGALALFSICRDLRAAIRSFFGE
jgi:hypothetical protein